MRFPSRFGFQAIHPACDLAVIQDWELLLPGGRLPTDYRSFLLRWNGGSFDDFVDFPLKDDDSEHGTLLSLGGLFDPAEQLDLRNKSTSYGFRAGVPANYVAIGDGGTWELLCISVAGPDAGHVYFWQPGEPWKDETPTTQFLRPVASSFQEFWELLYREDDQTAASPALPS